MALWGGGSRWRLLRTHSSALREQLVPGRVRLIDGVLAGTVVDGVRAEPEEALATFEGLVFVTVTHPAGREAVLSRARDIAPRAEVVDLLDWRR